MALLDLFSRRRPDAAADMDPTRFAAPGREDAARRATLAYGDPCAAVSMTPRSMSGKLGRSLRVVLGQTANESLPGDIKTLLRRLR